MYGGETHARGRTTSEHLRVDLEALLRDIERLRSVPSGRDELLDAVLQRAHHAAIVFDARTSRFFANREAIRLWGGTDGAVDWQRCSMLDERGASSALASWLVTCAKER